MKHLRIVLPGLLILTLVTLACGLGRPKPTEQVEVPAPPPTTAPAQPSPPPSLETQPPATEPQGEAPTQVPPTEEEAQAEEAELDLSASLSSLQNLNSYRNRFRIEWNGVKEGEPVSGYFAMSGAYVRQPPAREIHIEGQGLDTTQAQEMGQITIVQIGDTAWLYESESDTWVQLPAGGFDFAGGFLSPEEFITDFNAGKGRRSLFPQEVNGVQCYKYTFTEKDFEGVVLPAGEAVTRAQGEAYIAVDGGYVVKFVVDADVRYTSPEELFEEGTLTITFDIFDINQPITIEPPAEAKAQPAGRDDIPMLPDADIDFSSPEFFSYHTATSPTDAAQFYETEMPKNGWTAEEGNLIFDDGAFLNYTKGDETASVVIGTDENGTSVLVNIE